RQGDEWGSVSCVSVAPADVESLVHQVRNLARSRNYVWWIGPSSRPPDLVDRLRALGFREPRDRVALLRAVALTEEPRASPPEIAVTQIATFEDWAAAREVQWDAFDTPPERREVGRARLREDFAEAMA